MKTFKLFIAPWCFEQCSTVISSLLDVEEKLGIEFDIINANESYEVAKAYNVNAVPAIVVEDEREVIARFVADPYFNPNALMDFLEEVCDVGR